MSDKLLAKRARSCHVSLNAILFLYFCEVVNQLLSQYKQHLNDVLFSQPDIRHRKAVDGECIVREEGLFVRDDVCDQLARSWPLQESMSRETSDVVKPSTVFDAPMMALWSGVFS